MTTNHPSLALGSDLVAAPRAFVLDRTDRCDRCSAAAQVTAVMLTGGVLLMCQHHTNEHATKLLAQDALLYKADGSAY